MKHFFALITLVFGFQISISQTINQQVKDEDGKDMLLGTINKTGLSQAPFGEWFNTNHDAYAVNGNIVKQLKDSLNQYTIKAFLGTWCGDSKREVPHFYSVLETAKFPMNQLEVIALDHGDATYKKGPNGEEKGMNIHRVPTFIFYKDGKEINRIVESPKETLERDIEKIINGKRYLPKYFVANMMFSYVENQTLEDLRKMENNFLSYLPEYSEGSKELNTLGYIYKRSNQLEKAIYIFDLNTKMFPFNPNVYDSLGETYIEMENYTEALKNYTKVLTLKPKDENAWKMLEKIKAANIENKS